MVTARVEASLRHHTTPLMCHSNHPAWLGNPGSMSHSVLDRDVMPACHRNNRGATTHEPNINPSAGSIALGGACPGEMDAIPVALDSIPRLAPEDVAENVRTRTAAVTSHNCHSRQQNAISARRQLFHIRDSAYRMPGHLGRHAACQACYARWLPKQYRHKRRVCRVCREEFSTVRRDAKFCLSACRQANNRRLQYNGESDGQRRNYA
jgi:hypothetical protein